MEAELLLKLENVKYVSTTADLWSANRKSYFGMTAHWIDKEHLSRESVALACCRMTGTHSYYNLAKKIDEIHHKFPIQNKVPIKN